MNKTLKKAALIVVWFVVLLVLCVWAESYPSVIGFPISWASLIGWYGHKVWDKI